MSLRDLPANVEAERSLLGSVLLKPSLWPQITMQFPTADAFFLPAHQEIFSAMGVLAERDLPLDPVTVVEEIKSRGLISKIDGGLDYLLGLAESTPTAENAAAYIAYVRQAANKRRLIHLCAEIASRAHGDVDDSQLAEEAMKGLSQIILRSADELTRLGESVPTLLKDIEDRKSKGPRGVCTGISALDDKTWGFLPEELVIVGGDPGAGKSALALQTALRVCIEEEGTCFAASLEMGKAVVAERALAHMAEINSFYLRRGMVSIDDWRELYRAGTILQKLDFYVEDRVRTVREFAAKARVWRARHPNKKALAIFDFLQLASGDARTRAQQVGNDARELKELAIELHVPIIGVSSLNRDSKDAAEKPPTMKSLKESGDVEYAADFVLLIWNRHQTKDGPVSIISAKTRNGGGANEFVDARWTGSHYRFTDLDPHETPPEQQELSVA